MYIGIHSEQFHVGVTWKVFQDFSAKMQCCRFKVCFFSVVKQFQCHEINANSIKTILQTYFSIFRPATEKRRFPLKNIAPLLIWHNFPPTKMFENSNFPQRSVILFLWRIRVSTLPAFVSGQWGRCVRAVMMAWGEGRKRERERAAPRYEEFMGKDARRRRRCLHLT